MIRCIKEATKIDEDKPALGQYFCLPCDKYFCDEKALQTHLKQKPHKRRLKALETEPHSQEIADWAAGVGSRKRKRETTPSIAHKLRALCEDPQIAESLNRGEISLDESYLAVD
nr:zinc finger C2H2 type [Hymenolepis microstoma]